MDTLLQARDIVEEFELVPVVLGDLTFVISLNVIHKPQLSIVLGLAWFKLHNLVIDWTKETI